MGNAFVQLHQPNVPDKKVQAYENTIAGEIVEAQAVSLIDGTALTNSYVQAAPDGDGKKIQYFQNVIEGQTVHALAVTLVTENGLLP